MFSYSVFLDRIDTSSFFESAIQWNAFLSSDNDDIKDEKLYCKEAI